jgi:hypothetical protein
MTNHRRLAVVVVVLIGGLGPARVASAGPFWDWLTHRECPSPSYSPVNYWAPSAVHLYADIHGPKVAVRAPETHPDVPPTYVTLTYRRKCPAQDPAATLIPVPTPPATSKAR